MTAARSPDAPLLRRVRLRLILWSGGSTLLLVAILGGLLYWAAATRLRSVSIDQLTERAASLDVSGVALEPALVRSLPVTADPASMGIIVGGPLSGTIAVVVPAGGAVPVGAGAAAPVVVGSTNGGTTSSGSAGTSGAGTGTPSGPAFEIGGSGPTEGSPGATVSGGPTGGAPVLIGGPFITQGDGIPIPAPGLTIPSLAPGQTVIDEAVLGGLPIRYLARRVDVGGQTLTIQVLADRTAEVRTLETLVLVLVLGSLVLVAAAAALGYVYAGRALVPIRSSLQRQREFAADASHELRTPLAIVTTALEHLRRRPDDPAAVARAIGDLEAGTGRLTGMVDDLLLLARADADAVELARAPLDLAEIAAEALAAHEALAGERGVLLRLDIEPAPAVGDEARLTQLTGILLDNALRHAPAGTAVTLRVRPGATLVVEDEGTGIRDEDLPNLFRRFWRAADAPAGGTGLGLAIADWIATSHGGAIRAGNRPEGGARFEVTLPAG